MAVSLFALLRRFRGAFAGSSRSPRPPVRAARPAQARSVTIQPLEGRKMFSGGHLGSVVGEQLLGTETGVTGIVLTFDQHLDPTTAHNPKGYSLARRITSTSTDSGGLFGSPTTNTTVDTKHVRIASAVYDDATMTVTLTPTKPFRADKYFRLLRVAGRGPNAILGAGGAAINGGGDAVIKFSSKKGHKLSWKDENGNKVTLRLSGPGEMRALFRRTGTIAPIVFVVGSNPLTSVLTGTVTPGRHGTGVTTLQELSGTGTFANGLAGNAAFNVELTEP